MSEVRERVLEALADGREHWGYELCGRLGLASGTVYPVLLRLKAEGLVESRWDERRRYYRKVVEDDG